MMTDDEKYRSAIAARVVEMEREAADRREKEEYDRIKDIVRQVLAELGLP